jgi:hypothetical protein
MSAYEIRFSSTGLLRYHFPKELRYSSSLSYQAVSPAKSRVASSGFSRFLFPKEGRYSDERRIFLFGGSAFHRSALPNDLLRGRLSERKQASRVTRIINRISTRRRNDGRITCAFFGFHSEFLRLSRVASSGFSHFLFPKEGGNRVIPMVRSESAGAFFVTPITSPLSVIRG